MRIHLTLAAALAIAAAAVTPVHAAPPPEKLGLMELNNSGEDGEVTLSAQGSGKTLVSVSLEGAPKGVAQPAHIHKGNCDRLNPVPAYPLNPVVNGRSTTVVNAPLSKLMSGNYAVNVHQSTKNLKHYVACGELVR